MNCIVVSIIHELYVEYVAYHLDSDACLKSSCTGSIELLGNSARKSRA